MPVRPPPPLVPARPLADFVGQCITITDAPLKRVEGKFPNNPSFIATLSGGQKVWLTKTNFDSFEGGHAGTYDVESYEAYGKTCFALRNHEAPPEAQ